ncbi:hypothetical protein PG991_013047 [Apiospora marii]|uniref:Uncharacterized protein n=1 Tax=Apiospora marii TaxID=335849 RepID=A0ABR1RBF6_9PEZI
MPSYLITGTSRGLGLGFVTELLKNPDNVVIATARDPAKSSGLQELKAKHGDGQLHLVSLDVTEPDSVHSAAEAAQKLLPNGLDYLISNAGVNYSPLKSLDELDMDDFKAEMEFNVTSPMYLFREFSPLVRKSSVKKIMVLSSALGSLSSAGPTWAPVMPTRLPRLRSTCYVGATDMGAGIGKWIAENIPDLPSLSTETSCSGCLKVLHDSTPDYNGLFFSHDGTKCPW